MRTELDMIYLFAETVMGFAWIEYQTRIQNPDNHPQRSFLQKYLKPLTIFVKNSILDISYFCFLTFDILKLSRYFEFVIIVK